jgi:hypothetical protein
VEPSQHSGAPLPPRNAWVTGMARRRDVRCASERPDPGPDAAFRGGSDAGANA